MYPRYIENENFKTKFDIFNIEWLLKLHNEHLKSLESTKYKEMIGISDSKECVMNLSLTLPGSFESTK